MNLVKDLSPEEFNYISGSSGLNAYIPKTGPPVQTCPHMQGAAFYQLFNAPQARLCQACERMWYCSPECQKELRPVHQELCVNQYASLPGVMNMLQPLAHVDLSFTAGPSTRTASVQASEPNRIDLDVSDALLRGVPNRNAMGKKSAYDQLTPALTALFGRHAPASQRLFWCDTRSNDHATKLARKNFTTLKDEKIELMVYAHSKFISTRMRGAIVFNLDTPCGSGDWMLGQQRFNWLTYADAQMTLSVKLQEVIRSYDPAKAFVVVMYALSPDHRSAALWAWTYTERSRADEPRCMDMRIQIRQMLKDTKRGEKHMYTVMKDQNDF